MSSFLETLPARAAVNLLYFRAKNQQGTVLLEWETGSEVDTAGFYVSRSSSSGGTFIRLNATLIFSTGDALIGSRYNYQDENVILNQTYWYRLEIMDTSSNVTYSEVQSATPSLGTSTSTASLTPTPTPSRTPSPTPSITPIPSATRSPTPSPTSIGAYPAVTNTLPPTARMPTLTPTLFLSPTPGQAYPGQADGTLYPPPAVGTMADTPEFSLISTPGELVPFPMITIQFPTQVQPLGGQEPRVPPPMTIPEDPGRYMPLLLVLAAWFLLAGLYFMVERRFS